MLLEKSGSTRKVYEYQKLSVIQGAPGPQPTTVALSLTVTQETVTQSRAMIMSTATTKDPQTGLGSWSVVATLASQTATCIHTTTPRKIKKTEGTKKREMNNQYKYVTIYSII